MKQPTTISEFLDCIKQGATAQINIGTLTGWQDVPHVVGVSGDGFGIWIEYDNAIVKRIIGTEHHGLRIKPVTKTMFSFPYTMLEFPNLVRLTDPVELPADADENEPLVHIPGATFCGKIIKFPVEL